MNKWRPRFSVRTLAIFVTLVCVYFGAWEATKRYGVENIDPKEPQRFREGPCTILGEDDSPDPLIISRVEFDIILNHHGRADHVDWGRQRYYLWLFGPKIKLPLETKWSPFDG